MFSCTGWSSGPSAVLFLFEGTNPKDCDASPAFYQLCSCAARLSAQCLKILAAANSTLSLLVDTVKISISKSHTALYSSYRIHKTFRKVDPWPRGPWDPNSSDVFSRYTDGINFNFSSYRIHNLFRQGVSHQLKPCNCSPRADGVLDSKYFTASVKNRDQLRFQCGHGSGVETWSCAWIVSDVLLDEVWSAFDVAFLPQCLCYWESSAWTLTENSVDHLIQPKTRKSSFSGLT